MSGLTVRFRKFLGDVSGVATAEWVAVTSVFVILGIIAVYEILGDDDSGMIAIVNGQNGQLTEMVDDVENLLADVNSWTPPSE